MAVEDLIITRSAMSGVIPEDVAISLIGDVQKGDSLLQHLNVRTLTGPVKNTVTLDAIVGAEWVDIDGGKKPVGKMGTVARQIKTGEIAVIVGISDNTIRDVEWDIVEAIKREGGNALRRKLEQTILYGGMTGYTKGSGLPDGLVKQAIAAGNKVVKGAVAGEDIGHEVNKLMGVVEGQGYTVTNFLADRTLKSTLRGLRNAGGNFLYQPSMLVGTPDVLYGVATPNVDNKVWDGAKAKLIAYDRSQIDVGIYTTMEYKVSQDGTIVDSNGDVISALQHDLTFIRITFRPGYQFYTDKANTFPAAVYTLS